MRRVRTGGSDGAGARVGGPCGSSLSVALIRSGLCVTVRSGDVTRIVTLQVLKTTMTVKRLGRETVLTHEEVKAKKGKG